MRPLSLLFLRALNNSPTLPTTLNHKTASCSSQLAARNSQLATRRTTRLGSRVVDPVFFFFFWSAPQGETRNDTEHCSCQVIVTVTVTVAVLCHRHRHRQSVFIILQHFCPHPGLALHLVPTWIGSVRFGSVAIARRRSSLLRFQPRHCPYRRRVHPQSRPDLVYTIYLGIESRAYTRGTTRKKKKGEGEEGIWNI